MLDNLQKRYNKQVKVIHKMKLNKTSRNSQRKVKKTYKNLIEEKAEFFEKLEKIGMNNVR